MHLPEDFIKNTRPILKEEWDNFRSALEQDIHTSIRINPNKVTLQNPTYKHVAWSKYGYYLPERPSFTFDPLFHLGAYYVQEASSMFVEQVFRQYIQDKDITVLDLCAAPGGKSTHIASLISENSLLVSNEVIRSRSKILSENITKAGYPNTIVTNNDPADFRKLPAFFDVILIDAPCSGEGMFRKDNEAVNEWSLSNVRLCQERQRRIIADVWDSLKPEGLLIYSTCTYNRDENEDNVLWMKSEFDAEDLRLDIPPEWGITAAYDENIHAYHFFPHKVKGEGFFLSVLRKKEGELHRKKDSSKKGNKQKANILSKEYLCYIHNPEEYQVFDKTNLWFAFPKHQYEDFLTVTSNLKLVSAGVHVGETKGKDFIPHHSLAMSSLLNVKAFHCFDVDWKTAISYLRRDNLTFEELPKGYILLTYKNIPLGFIKNIGNRTNNLYPGEWRIHSPHIPNNEVNII